MFFKKTPNVYFLPCEVFFYFYEPCYCDLSQVAKLTMLYMYVWVFAKTITLVVLVWLIKFGMNELDLEHIRRMLEKIPRNCIFKIPMLYSWGEKKSCSLIINGLFILINFIYRLGIYNLCIILLGRYNL